MSTQSTERRELFGGAIVAAIPPTMADASDFRVVPDHQEVFMHPVNGTCIIIELTQRQAAIPDSEAAPFQFNDLASANAAASPETSWLVAPAYHSTASPPAAATTEATIVASTLAVSEAVAAASESGIFRSSRVMPSPADAQLRCFIDSCIGWQRVSKFREKNAQNDVLVALSVVRIPAPYDTDVVISVSMPQRIDPRSSDAKYVTEMAEPRQCVELLIAATASLRVVDFGLFVV